MCGIAGYISTNTISSQTKINAMLDATAHRGPDGRGVFLEDRIALGHVRLSIIDVASTSNQPMFSKDGNLVVVFNGEIFNYQTLKEKYKSSYSFKTNSDTEVILAAYQNNPSGFLNEFEGMFSFVIYDKSKQKVFGARDPFGIKPFYFHKTENDFIFCSEIKGVLAHSKVSAELNEKLLYDFLIFNRTDHAKETSFEGIENLQPGHQFSFDLKNNTFKEERWYDLPELTYLKSSLDKEQTNLRKKLNESMELHLVSDVEVGSALSGGIDSSIVVSLMRECLGDKKIASFSAVYDSSWERDEKKYVDQVVKEKNITPHFAQPNAKSLLEDIDDLIYQQEEPFASASIFASWSVYKKAGEVGTKVLLNGQGADEVFSYDYMAAFYFYELFLKFRWGKLVKEMLLFKKKQSATKFTFLLFMFACAPKFLKDKLLYTSNKSINKSFFQKYKAQSQFYTEFFKSKTLNENVKNHLLMKLNHLLRIEDKNSMKFGVEARVPFLHTKLVEYALNLPSKFKVKNGEVKYILKHSTKDVLPKLIFERNNKIGYETPMDSWMREDHFVKEVNKMLSEKRQPMEKYLDLEFVKAKWDLHQKGENNSSVVWKYYYLTKWYNLYFTN